MYKSCFFSILLLVPLEISVVVGLHVCRTQDRLCVALQATCMYMYKNLVHVYKSCYSSISMLVV